MDSNKFKELYKLSDFKPIFDPKKQIRITALGKLFNLKIEQYTGYNVILSNCSYNGNLRIDIAVNKHLIGDHGMIFYHENSCIDMKNLICKNVLRAWNESIIEYGLPKISYNYEVKGILKQCNFNLMIIDFIHRVRVNCFSLYINTIEKLTQIMFDKISFIIRIKDDDHELYYLIFDNETELQKAEQLYGISNMIDYVHEICKQNDIYHAFDDYCPKPEVATKDILLKQGRVMGIMRNNPQFSRW